MGVADPNRWKKMQQLAQTGLYTPTQIAEMVGSSRNVVYKVCSGLPYRVERPRRILDEIENDPIPTVDFHPTDALPGTAEKVAVLAARVLLGQPLWHKDDRNNFRGVGLTMPKPKKDFHAAGRDGNIKVCAVPKGGKGLG